MGTGAGVRRVLAGASVALTVLLAAAAPAGAEDPQPAGVGITLTVPDIGQNEFFGLSFPAAGAGPVQIIDWRPGPFPSSLVTRWVDETTLMQTVLS